MGLLDRSLHLLVEGLVWIAVWWTLFTRRVRSLFLSRRRVDAAVVSASCASLSLPHLSAVLPNGSVDVASVEFLAALMVASGAGFVSLFQEQGELKERLRGRLPDRVRLIDREEAEKGLVMGAVRSCVEDVRSGAMALEDISEREICRRLPLQCPDVALVLCFDGPRRNGFLPFNIRVSTFVDAGDLSLLRQPHFLDLLLRFGRVQQRFGA